MEEDNFLIFSDNPLTNHNTLLKSKNLNPEVLAEKRKNINPPYMNHYYNNKPNETDANSYYYDNSNNNISNIHKYNNYNNYNNYDNNNNYNYNNIHNEKPADNEHIVYNHENKFPSISSIKSLHRRKHSADLKSKSLYPSLLKKPNLVTKWPPLLESLFEESIYLIPKKAIKNIKICGSTHGRNQYISFYIYDKSGIRRTAKQVSSHIQAINNAKKDLQFLQLLKNGPGDTPEICHQFIMLFTEIIKRNPPNFKDIITNKIVDQIPEDLEYPQLKEPPATKIIFKKFEMSYVNFQSINESNTFSSIHPNLLNKDLPETKLPEYVFLGKFPIIANILSDQNSKKIQNISTTYGNVLISLPSFFNDLKTGSYNLSSKISLFNLPAEEKSYGLITIITSNNFKIYETFQHLEPLSVKSKTEVILSIDIGSNYWKDYILHRQIEFFQNNSIDETRLSLEINSLLMHQLIVNYDNKSVQPNNPNITSTNIDSNKIRSILIWKFEKVNDSDQATTLINKISILPESNTPKQMSQPYKFDNPPLYSKFETNDPGGSSSSILPSNNNINTNNQGYFHYSNSSTQLIQNQSNMISNNSTQYLETPYSEAYKTPQKPIPEQYHLPVCNPNYRYMQKNQAFNNLNYDGAMVDNTPISTVEDHAFENTIHNLSYMNNVTTAIIPTNNSYDQKFQEQSFRIPYLQDAEDKTNNRLFISSTPTQQNEKIQHNYPGTDNFEEVISDYNGYGQEGRHTSFNNSRT